MTAHSRFSASTPLADDPELLFFNAQDVHPLLTHIGFTRDAKDKSKWSKGHVSYSVFYSRQDTWLCTDHRIKKTHGVVSLIRSELGLSLGAARIELRRIYGTAAAPIYTRSNPSTAAAAHTTTSSSSSTSPVSSSPYPDSNPSTVAPEMLPEDEIRKRYARGLRYDPAHHPEILSARGLEYIAPDYHDSFRLTSSGQIVFPTYRFDGETGLGVITGYETCRPDGGRFFLRGGSAGVWTAGIPSRDGMLVIAESAYDALAFSMTHGLGRGSALAAVRSGAEQHVANLARWLISEELVEIVLISTDNDSPGLAYASKIMLLLEDMRRRGEIRDGIRVEYVPPGYKPRAHYVNDPNDHLQRIISENPEARGLYIKQREDGATGRNDTAAPSF
jgi:hypothetical protein